MKLPIFLALPRTPTPPESRRAPNTSVGTNHSLRLPDSSEFTVTVTPGRIGYLGTVFVRATIQVVPNAERERATWDAFLKKYPQTPWVGLARARLDSLPGH